MTERTPEDEVNSFDASESTLHALFLEIAAILAYSDTEMGRLAGCPGTCLTCGRYIALTGELCTLADRLRLLYLQLLDEAIHTPWYEGHAQ